jgi:hypothetical protein
VVLRNFSDAELFFNDVRDTVLIFAWIGMSMWDRPSEEGVVLATFHPQFAALPRGQALLSRYPLKMNNSIYRPA